MASNVGVGAPVGQCRDEGMLLKGERAGGSLACSCLLSALASCEVCTAGTQGPARSPRSPAPPRCRPRPLSRVLITACRAHRPWPAQRQPVGGHRLLLVGGAGGR